MAITFFSLNVEKATKTSWKICEDFFFSEKASFFAENQLFLARRPFFVFFFGGSPENFFRDLLFFIFLENTCALCPWSLASRGSVLEK